MLKVTWGESGGARVRTQEVWPVNGALNSMGTKQSMDVSQCRRKAVVTERF